MTGRYVGPHRHTIEDCIEQVLDRPSADPDDDAAKAARAAQGDRPDWCALIGTFMGQPQYCGEPARSRWHQQGDEAFQHEYVPLSLTPPPNVLDVERLQLAVALPFQDHHPRGEARCECGWRPNLSPATNHHEHLMLLVLEAAVSAGAETEPWPPSVLDIPNPYRQGTTSWIVFEEGQLAALDYLRAQGEPPQALDVKRLAEVLAVWFTPVSEHVNGPGTYTVTLDPQAAAEHIAAAYARLTSEATD